MNISGSEQSNLAMSHIVEVSIRLLAVAVLILWSFRLLAPFLNPIIWAAVIAVVTYPLFGTLSAWLGRRRKLAAFILVLLALALILAPVIMMSTSLLESAQALGQKATEGTLEVPLPPDGIKSWPVVGEPLHEAWQQASANLKAFVAQYEPQIKSIGAKVLAGVAGAGTSLLLLVVSILIAAFLLLKSESCVDGMARFTTRLAGKEKGEAVLALATATVRSVAVGVLGVAFIQSFLATIGMFFAGVPAVGIWALAILLLAIMQLPPLLVLLPLAIWVFGSSDSQVTAWIFLVYSVVVSFSDTLLKPLMMGRGVEVPMPVILLGAIGGMIQSGILGLFVGAVVLALSYRLLIAWLEMDTRDGAVTQ